MPKIVSGSRAASPNALRFDIAGDHLSALILDRLEYWTPRARIRVKGLEWIAKSREELAHETRLSAQQLRNSLERLKARDLIETMQRPFAGKNVLHLRLSDCAKTAMRDAGLLKGWDAGPNTQPKSGPETQLEAGPHTQLHIQDDTNKKILQENTVGTSKEVPTTFSEIPKKRITGKGIAISPKKGLKAPTPLPPAPTAKVSHSSASSPVVSKAKARGVLLLNGKNHSLGAVWTDALAKAYPDEQFDPLTLQQRGQIAHLAKKLLGLDVEKVIRSVISDWPAFTEKCAREACAFNAPLRPQPGFALKFAAQAANFKASNSTASWSQIKNGSCSTRNKWME